MARHTTSTDLNSKQIQTRTASSDKLVTWKGYTILYLYRWWW